MYADATLGRRAARHEFTQRLQAKYVDLYQQLVREFKLSNSIVP